MTAFKSTSAKKGDRMTIGKARTFILQGLKNHNLRERLNTAPTSSEFYRVLSDENLHFSAHDFDEAFHHLLTQCQKAEQAEQLKEFRMWWILLFRSFVPAPDQDSCPGCNPQ